MAVSVSTPVPEIPDPEADESAPGPDADILAISARYYIYANGTNAGLVHAASSGLDGIHALTPAVDRADDLHDIERWINVQRSGNIFVLHDSIRNIRTVNSAGNYIRKGFFGWDRAAVSAHFNLAEVYDFYKKDMGKRTFGFADPFGLGTGIKNHAQRQCAPSELVSRRCPARILVR